MQGNADAFDRAVSREEKLRHKAALFDSPKRLLKLYWRAMFALGVAWAVLLAAHWIFWSSPRWLVIAHTIVFGVTAVMFLATRGFFAFVMRRRPDWFEDFQED